MKHTLIIAALGISLLSACSKTEAPQPATATTTEQTMMKSSAPAYSPSQATTPTSGEVTNGAAIKVRLLSMLPPGALIMWQGGNMTVGSVYMDVYQQNGNMLSKDHFETAIGQNIKWSSMMDLGIIVANPSISYATDFGISLYPTNNSSALYLTGTYKSWNDVTNSVTLILNEPLVLRAKWDADAALKTGGEYTAAISFDMAQLTNGISSAMLDKANALNGTIAISAITNVELYNIIKANLENQLAVRYR